jgi:leucyl-tRNA synthetase
MLVEDMVEIIVQVNGKLREMIRFQSAKSRIQNVVEKSATESEKVKKHLEGKTIRKVIFVPGRLINFVY